MNMKVILREDVKGKGVAGDVIDVKPGFARNFLVPKGLAYLSTAKNQKVFEHEKARKAKEQEKFRLEAVKQSEELEKISLTAAVKVGDDGKLFGSVTPEMIAEAMLAEGIEIDKKKIILDEPIKALGVYNVSVKLHPEVSAEIRVWVVKK